MNIIKKTTALVIAFLMVVSVLPAMASVTAETIADEIELSMLTTDAQDRIANNLDLSVEEIKELYPDAKISWRSSKPEVLTVVGKSGVLTRGTADENVTLTAIVYLGEEVAEKDFDLTVSKRHSKVARQENFEGEEVLKNTALSDVSALKNNGVTTPAGIETNYAIEVVEDPKDSSNSCLSIYRINAENDTRQVYVDVSAGEGTNRWIIKYRVRVDENAKAGSSYLYLGGKGKKGGLNDQAISCTISKFSSTGAYFREGETESANLIRADLTQWATITIDFNINAPLRRLSA